MVKRFIEKAAVGGDRQGDTAAVAMAKDFVASKGCCGWWHVEIQPPPTDWLQRTVFRAPELWDRAEQVL